MRRNSRRVHCRKSKMPMLFNCLAHVDLLLAAAPVPVLEPASPNAATLRYLFLAAFLICLAIFVIVVGLIGISLVRFRATSGTNVPKQNFGSRRSEVAWAIPPLLITFTFAVISARLILSIIAMPIAQASEATRADIIVVGHQFWWEVRYPASGAVTANEIHIPIGRKLCVRVESADVIHSFWVPQLAPKMGMIPGHPNFLWLQADRPGIYEGACSQFCGAQHAWMRFTVVAESGPRYETWLAQQTRPAGSPSSADAQAGRKIFFAQTCANCHAIGGTNAVANAAPDLTHVASRSDLAAGVIPNTPQNLAAWLRNPQQIKPGCQMPNFNFNEEQVTQLVAYLEDLR